MTELAPKVKIAILEAKVAQYAQSAYSAQIDARVAEALDDDRMRQAAVESLKKIERAKDVLEQELAAVQGEAEEPGA